MSQGRKSSFAYFTFFPGLSLYVLFDGLGQTTQDLGRYSDSLRRVCVV